MMRLAVMQPYFLPYAGYFRLLNCCDVFVVYDCVQFPRRGWVHRNYFTTHAGNKEFLSLPLMKHDRNTTQIKDLQFRTEEDFILKQYNKFPILKRVIEGDPVFKTLFENFDQTPLDYIQNLLLYVAKQLDQTPKIIRSSSFAIDPSIKGQDRIIEICKKVDAQYYINLSGGRDLYEQEVFKHHNIVLQFLNAYEGSFLNVLENAVLHGWGHVMKEVQANCCLNE